MTRKTPIRPKKTERMAIADDIRRKRNSVFDSINGVDVLKLKELEESYPTEIEMTEEELINASIKKNRMPYDDDAFPDELPTMGQMPLPIDEHLMIGDFESKHNLYLTMAVAYNTLIKRIKKLELEVEKLKK